MAQNNTGATEGLEKVDALLTKAKTFYLATMDGEQPRCRPIGFHLLSRDRLYFGVGEFKEVFRQMSEHPQVEICALIPGGFLRYYGTAVFEPDYQLAEEILAASSDLQKIYNDTTGYKLGIFHLERGAAELRGMLDVKETLTFA